MSITATELKANLGKYLSPAATEDIFITQYGKVVANLSSPFQDRLAGHGFPDRHPAPDHDSGGSTRRKIE